MYIFFLKRGGCLFYVKHGFLLMLTLEPEYVHCKLALYVKPIYMLFA